MMKRSLNFFFYSGRNASVFAALMTSRLFSFRPNFECAWIAEFILRQLNLMFALKTLGWHPIEMLCSRCHSWFLFRNDTFVVQSKNGCFCQIHYNIIIYASADVCVCMFLCWNAFQLQFVWQMWILFCVWPLCDLLTYSLKMFFFSLFCVQICHSQ